MPQLDYNNFFSQIFWLLLTFGILYFVSKFFIIPKIELTKNIRKKLIDDNIMLSKELSKEIINTKLQYDQLQKTLEADLNNMKLNSLKELENYKANQSKLLNFEFQNIKNQLQLEIETIYKEVNENYQKSCCTLANLIIERLTNKPAKLEKLNKIYQDHCL